MIIDLNKLNEYLSKLTNNFVVETYKDSIILSLKEIINIKEDKKTAIIAGAFMLLKENIINPNELNAKLEEYILLIEDAPANCAGGGAIAGIGIGPQGEPGVFKKNINKYKKKNQIRRIIDLVNIKPKV